MSNRQFKTLLNNGKYILFDYGQLDSLPQIDSNLAGICSVGGIFYIKQRNSNQWTALLVQTLLLDVLYNNDNSDQNYWWICKYDDSIIEYLTEQTFSNENLLSFKCTSNNMLFNNLLLWQHNQNKFISCQFFRTVDNEQHRNIKLPYCHINRNIILADFSGFLTEAYNQNQRFYITSS